MTERVYKTPAKKREANRAWAAAHKDKMREYARQHQARTRKKYKSDPQRYKDWYQRHPEKAMWQSARQRAKKQNVPFAIDPSDIVIPLTCPVLGIPLKRNPGIAGPDSPSLDKIEPSLGYVKGNIVVISSRANLIKTNATPSEVMKVAIWLNEGGYNL